MIKPMRKTLSVILAMGLAVSAFAQDYFPQEEPAKDPQLFNHLAIGFDLINLDGMGIQIAAPVTPYLQLRGTFQFMDAHVAAYNAVVKSIAKSKDLEVLKGGINPFLYSAKNLSIDQSGIKIDQVDLSATLQSRTIDLLLDVFPGKNTIFHFTVGAVFSLTPKGNITASANALYEGHNAIPESDRTTTRIFGITTDKDGLLHAGVQYKLNAVRPYFGIGTGRPVSRDKRVSVSFDFGVQYTGGARLVSYDYFDNPDKPQTVVLDAAWLAKYPDLKDAIGESTYDQIQQYLGYLNMVPVVPVLKLSLFVRLF